MRTSLMLLLPMLALAGCLNSQRSALHVVIADVSIANATLGASEATFTLNVANQEVFTTVVERDTHRIFVDGTLIGTASGTEAYPLTRMGVSPRVVKVQVSEGSAMEVLRAAIQRGRGEYSIESRFWTNSGGDKVTVRNTSSGTFTIASR
jgi:hypothetical protein